MLIANDSFPTTRQYFVLLYVPEMNKILSFFLSQYSLIQTGLSTILLDLHFPPISIKFWFFFKFENLIPWYWGKNTKMDISQLCKWEGCNSQISTDFAFSFIENGSARMLSTVNTKPINLLHPNLSLLRSPLRSSPLLFKMNLWLALLYGVLPTRVWTCCKQNTLTPTSLPTTPISLPSLHGHICWWSLCFHSSHSLLSPPPSGSVMETAPGGHHWPPCCKIQCTLISLSFFNLTSQQHLTTDCSRLLAFPATSCWSLSSFSGGSFSDVFEDVSLPLLEKLVFPAFCLRSSSSWTHAPCVSSWHL